MKTNTTDYLIKNEQVKFKIKKPDPKNDRVGIDNPYSQFPHSIDFLVLQY
ncbi:hypothetical protein [Chryseobacterium sp. CT-SW4]